VLGATVDQHDGPACHTSPMRNPARSPTVNGKQAQALGIGHFRAQPWSVASASRRILSG